MSYNWEVYYPVEKLLVKVLEGKGYPTLDICVQEAEKCVVKEDLKSATVLYSYEAPAQVTSYRIKWKILRRKLKGLMCVIAESDKVFRSLEEASNDIKDEYNCGAENAMPKKYFEIVAKSERSVKPKTIDFNGIIGAERSK